MNNNKELFDCLCDMWHATDLHCFHNLFLIDKCKQCAGVAEDGDNFSEEMEKDRGIKRGAWVELLLIIR